MNLSDKIEIINLKTKAIQEIVRTEEKIEEIERKVQEIGKSIDEAQRILTDMSRPLETVSKMTGVEVDALQSLKKENSIDATSVEVDIKELVKEELEYKEKLQAMLKALPSEEVVEAKKMLNYIKVYSEFLKLNEEIKKIEKISKKSVERVETLSSEDRKKEIDRDLVKQYNEYVSQKKNISKEALKAYNAIMAYDVNLDEKKDEESIEYEKVSAETNHKERLKIVNREMQNIISNPSVGDKVNVGYKGNIYQMTKLNRAKFLYLANQKKSLETILKIESEAVSELHETQSNIIPLQSVVEQPKKVLEDAFGNPLVGGPIIIESVDKTQRTEMKQKIKKFAIRAAVGVAAVVAAVSIGKFQPTSKSNVSQVSVEIENNEDKDIELSNPISSIVGSVVHEDSTAETVEENSKNLSLGDNFTVAEDSKIMSNEYDATNYQNGRNPYYDADSIRTVAGIVYQLPDGKVVVAKNAQEVALYESMNGENITAYLAGSERGSEGFYNVQDVVVNDELNGGMHR